MDSGHMDLDSLLAQPTTAYRSLAAYSALERIGLGFHDKSGQEVDEAGGTRTTYSLVHILRGRGRFIDHRGCEHELRPGGCFIRRPGIPHSLFIDPASRWLECWLDLGPELYTAIERMQCLRGLPEAWNGMLQLAAARRCRGLLDRLRRADDYELPALMAEVLGLHAELAASARSASEGSDLITRACRFLAEAANRQLGLRAFCAQCGIGYERFRKRFQQAVGCSPEQYRIRRRIERACQLLEGSDETVAAIAERLGYCSAFDFSAQFRKQMGLAPSHYRGHKRSSA